MATLNDANLSGANLSGANLESGQLDDADLTSVNATGTDLGYANSTDASLTDADLTDATTTAENLTGVTLGGAVVTGTDLIPPPNETAIATSDAGWVASWPTIDPVPGAKPGSCTPGSGTPIPVGTTTVTCQIFDADGNAATGTFQISIDATAVLLPSYLGTVKGVTPLNATAYDSAGITKVVYELSGGPSDLTSQVIATATPTIYGWLAQWNSTTVPDGGYNVVSVATDSNNATYTSFPTPRGQQRPPDNERARPLQCRHCLWRFVGARRLGLAECQHSDLQTLREWPRLPGDRQRYRHCLRLARHLGHDDSTQWHLHRDERRHLPERTECPHNPVSITVKNPLATTSILIPAKATTLSGSTYLDASGSNATGVEFLLFGGGYGFDAPVICTATSTIYGWLCGWNTSAVPDGSYVLVAEATNSAGSAFSSGVSVSVDN